MRSGRGPELFTGNRVWWAVWSCGVVVSLWGCPDAVSPSANTSAEGSPCEFNSECADDTWCVDGFCGVECVADRDCATEQRCEAGRCVVTDAEDVGTPEDTDRPGPDAQEPDAVANDTDVDTSTDAPWGDLADLDKVPDEGHDGEPCLPDGRCLDPRLLCLAEVLICDTEGPDEDGAAESGPVDVLPGGGDTCLASTPVVDVPWVSQRLPDQTWSNLCCGPAVITMARGQLEGAPVNEASLRATIGWMDTNLPTWSARGGACSGTDSEEVVATVSGLFTESEARTVRADWCALKAQVSQDTVVIFHGDSQGGNSTDVFRPGSSHWLILDGCADGLCTINDPGRETAAQGEARTFTESSVRLRYETRGELAILVERRVALSCPGDCSGHGLCDAETGQCVCEPAYTAPACDACGEGRVNYPTCSLLQGCPSDCSGHGTCDGSTGQCDCATGFGGTTCDACDVGYTGYPDCTLVEACPNQCTNHGTCDSGTGTCGCEPPFTGTACDRCAQGYASYSECYLIQSCTANCSEHGACDDRTGVCACATGFTGSSCNSCAPGYANYPECYLIQSCTANCSNHGTCDDRTGVCACATGFAGASCNSCAPGYANYPECYLVQSCPENCSSHGTCDDQSGLCSCTTRFAGASCNSCAPGYANYSECYPIQTCPANCSGHGTCNDRTGACSCSTGFTGSSCSSCATGYYNYPTCPRCIDNDNDGHYASPCGDDCDDNDSYRYPGRSEVLDIRDNDCDGQQDELGLVRLERYYKAWSGNDWEHRFAASSISGWEADNHHVMVYPTNICTGSYRPADDCRSVSGGRTIELWGGFTLVALSGCTGTLGSSHITLYLTEDTGEYGDYSTRSGFTCTRVGYVFGGNTWQSFSAAKRFYRHRSDFAPPGVGDNMWSTESTEGSPTYSTHGQDWVAPGGL